MLNIKTYPIIQLMVFYYTTINGTKAFSHVTSGIARNWINRNKSKTTTSRTCYNGFGGFYIGHLKWYMYQKHPEASNHK